MIVIALWNVSEMDMSYHADCIIEPFHFPHLQPEALMVSSGRWQPIKRKSVKQLGVRSQDAPNHSGISVGILHFGCSWLVLAVHAGQHICTWDCTSHSNGAVLLSILRWSSNLDSVTLNKPGRHKHEEVQRRRCQCLQCQSSVLVLKKAKGRKMIGMACVGSVRTGY